MKFDPTWYHTPPIQTLKHPVESHFISLGSMLYCRPGCVSIPKAMDGTFNIAFFDPIYKTIMSQQVNVHSLLTLYITTRQL